MKKVLLIFLTICLCLLTSCGLERPPLQIQNEPTLQGEKKVIVIIVDSLVENPLTELMEQNKVPAFSFLKQQGWFTEQFVSSFPTMSVVIESTFLTGNYADKHHIPGLRWYDTNNKKLVNYGDGFYPSLRSGVWETAINGLYHLNNTHLNKESLTLHEELALKGKSSGSINALVYRGDVEQTLSVPAIGSITTMAPPYFVLGTFHHYIQSSPKDQYVKSYGVNDNVSVAHLKQLINKQELPSLTIMYMPDLDSESHEEGGNSAQTIIDIDRELQHILNSFGSWEEALKSHIFIIMGDSGFSKTKESKQEAIIDLAELFNPLEIAEPNAIHPNDQLVAAVNGRMAYVYSLSEEIKIPDLIQIAADDARIDTISRKDGEWIEVIRGGTGNTLRFRPGNSYTDIYSQTWDVQGDWSVLDLIRDKNSSQILFGSYPDALMQLYAAAHSHPGDYMIMTVAPGYEMTGAHSPTHPGGGNHGSFHEIDMHIPLFIVGTEKRPKTLRIVELKEYILDLLYLCGDTKRSLRTSAID